MSFWAEDRSVAVRFLVKLKGLSSTPPFFGPHPHPQPSCGKRKGEGDVPRERDGGRGGGKVRDKKKTAMVAQACNPSTEGLVQGQFGLYNFRPSGPHETVSNKKEQKI